MIHLRPQRVYKPSALSYLGNPSDIADSIIDRYSNKDLYRLRLETPRGTSITADNSQITCYAHIFDKEDGTELTDLLKGRGYRPTWLLDGKPVDSTCVSEDGYQLTLETTHLPDIYQAVTLQARDTDILLALTDESQDKAWLQRVIASGDFPTHLLQASEKLLNITQLNTIRVEGLEEIKQDLSKDISANRTALEELHKNPLTVDKDGYWRVWDITQHQYITTQYQSRGEKGEPGQAGATGAKGDKGDKGDKPVITLNDKYQLLADGALVSDVSLKGEPGKAGAKGLDGKNAGRYLGRAIRIGSALSDNYIPEDDSYFWRTADVGDYVYLTKNGDNWRKDTYYIVREHKDKTVWEEYNIKGRSPKVYLGSDYYLYVDDVQQQYLKGDPGHSPSVDEIIGNSTFANKLKAEIEGSEKFKSLEVEVADATNKSKDNRDMILALDQNYSEHLYYQDQRIGAVEDTYKVVVTTRGEIRNGKVYDGVLIDGKPAIQHTAHIYSLFGIDKSTTLGDKLTWTINKGRTANTDKPQERTDTGLICNVYDSDLVDNGINPRYYDIELESHINPSSTTLEHKAHVTSQDTAIGFRNLIKKGHVVRHINGRFTIYQLQKPITSGGTFTLSFEVYMVSRPPKGGRFLIKFCPASNFVTNVFIPYEEGKTQYSVTAKIEERHSFENAQSPNSIEIYPNEGWIDYTDPNCGYIVIKNVKFERGAFATEWSPAPEDEYDRFLNTRSKLAGCAKTAHLDNAFKYIQNIVREIDSSRSYTISESGYISSSVHSSCRNVSKEVAPSSMTCSIPNTQPQIRLTLRSDYDNLKAQVQTLAVKVAQLEARNVIKPDSSRDGQSTIYPKYDDWILTSDSREQYISFAGLNAEIGRSIYIQTRKRAYLYSIGHSYFGLPGSSTSENQWLSNNTTYRFVRASSDSWFVTASSSPYPWT